MKIHFIYLLILFIYDKYICDIHEDSFYLFINFIYLKLYHEQSNDRNRQSNQYSSQLGNPKD